MYRIFLSFLKQFLFWMLFFILCRVVFMLYHASFFEADHVPFAEVMRIFRYSIRLDVSTASYLLIIPFLLLSIRSLVQSQFLERANTVFSLFVVVIYALVVVGELGVYGEWRSKIDYRALYYLRHPQEVAESAKTGSFIILIVIFVALAGFASWCYIKLVAVRLPAMRRSWLFSIPFFLMVPIILFIGIRGGLQSIPINQAEAYFSKYNIVNHVAVNSGYNLYQSYLESRSFDEENPFDFYTRREAEQTVATLHSVIKDTTVSILSAPRPNVVLLLLESWTADLIESLGGLPGITPEFRKLEEDGLLFTDCYASGNRSQQAMSAIFSGFPAIPVTAITHHYDKFIKLPSLIKLLKQEGYASSYYFGGQLIYGGLRAYIMFAGFDRIIEEKDLNPSFYRGKLGVHDEFLLQQVLRDLDREKEPFFSAAFTLSSHSPYDEPKRFTMEWKEGEKDFILSAHYTDGCLGEFITEARKHPWYANTLFILMADHSHLSYRNYDVNTPQYRKIPMLLYGEVLREAYRGKRMNGTCSQTDFASTLLHQLNINTASFPWSRNLFNPNTRVFAYYEINVGCGWVTPDGNLVYQRKSGNYEQMNYPDSLKPIREREALSYLQVLYQQFLDY